MPFKVELAEVRVARDGRALLDGVSLRVDPGSRSRSSAPPRGRPDGAFRHVRL
ncbi:MAG: hypothetical protein ACSLFQ_23750 [Thermoanaerobaculia bacterium]